METTYKTIKKLILPKGICIKIFSFLDLTTLLAKTTWISKYFRDELPNNQNLDQKKVIKLNFDNYLENNEKMTKYAIKLADFVKIQSLHTFY